MAKTIKLLIVMFLFSSVQLTAGPNTIEGKVINKKGQPVQNVRVSIGAGNTDVDQPNTETNGQGRFQFKGLEDDVYALSFRKKGYKNSLKLVDFNEGSSNNKDIQIRLKKKNPLVLSITKNSEEIEKVEVDIQVMFEVYGFGYLKVMSRTETPEEGIVKIHDLPAGNYIVSVELSSKFQAKSNRFTWKSNKRKEISLDLKSTGTIRGQVKEKSSRKPVKAKISIPTLGKTVSSDDGGAFEMNVPEGRWSLIVRGENHSSKVLSDIQVQKDQTTNLQEISVDQGASAELRVVDGKKVLKNEKIIIVGRNGFSRIRKSNREGLIHIKNIPPGKYAIAKINPHMQISRTLRKGDNGTITFDVNKKRNFDVNVQSQQKPIPGAIVTVVPAHKVNSSWKLARSVTNRDGKAVIKGLNRMGKYVLLISVPRFTPHKKGNLTNIAYLVSHEKKHETFAFKLNNNNVTGTIYEAKDEKPIRNAQVSLIPKDLKNNRIKSIATMGMATSNKEGKFEIKHVPAGDYYMYARKRGYKTAVKEEIQINEKSDMSGKTFYLSAIDTDKLGSIKGQVKSPNDEPTSAMIFIRNKEGIPIREPLSTDAGGMFEIENIPNGTYIISAEGDKNTISSKKVQVKPKSVTKVNITVNKK